MRIFDLTGQRFGKWVVIERAIEDGSKWYCKCDCGNYGNVTTNALIKGKSKSCGCGKHYAKSSISTLCWECKNITKCEWSVGEPVPDWEAIPTKILLQANETINSYIVVKCPKFEARGYKRRKDLISEKAKELGVSERTILRRIKKGELNL